MKNIFENAYFGKWYKTRDGSKAIFICERTNNAVWDLNHPYACVIEGYGEIWNYYPNGRLYIGENFETENDIISEWEDPINEEKLYNIADLWVGDNGVENSNDGIEAFIAGYNFAKKGE